jgi:hypothetical protein
MPPSPPAQCRASQEFTGSAAASWSRPAHDWGEAMTVGSLRTLVRRVPQAPTRRVRSRAYFAARLGGLRRGRDSYAMGDESPELELTGAAGSRDAHLPSHGRELPRQDLPDAGCLAGAGVPGTHGFVRRQAVLASLIRGFRVRSPGAPHHPRRPRQAGCSRRVRLAGISVRSAISPHVPLTRGVHRSARLHHRVRWRREPGVDVAPPAPGVGGRERRSRL